MSGRRLISAAYGVSPCPVATSVSRKFRISARYAAGLVTDAHSYRNRTCRAARTAFANLRFRRAALNY